MDLALAIDIFDEIISGIVQLRTEAEKGFKTIFSEVEKKCESLRIVISIPRTTTTQKIGPIL